VDPGTFYRILQLSEIRAFFHNIVYISGESDKIFMKILTYMYSWTRSSALNFGSNPDPESGFGYRLLIQTRFSLAELCGL